MDICLVNIDDSFNKSLQPSSALGMLWLQTHFENEHWFAISNNEVILSEKNSKILVEDAKNAGLEIKTFSSISKLEVFQKKN